MATPRPQLPEDILTTGTITAKVKPQSLTKGKQINKTTSVGAKMISFSLKSTDWNAGDTEAEHPLKTIKESSQSKGKRILNKSCIRRVETTCSDLTTRRFSFIHSFVQQTLLSTYHGPRTALDPGNVMGTKLTKPCSPPEPTACFLCPPFSCDDTDGFKISNLKAPRNSQDSHSGFFRWLPFLGGYLLILRTPKTSPLSLPFTSPYRAVTAVSLHSCSWINAAILVDSL